MSSKSRLLVFLVSTPFVVLAAVGGLFGASASTSQQSFSQLRIFNDVEMLVENYYVEPVDVDRVWDGAMRGLADGLDASSAFLTPDEVKTLASGGEVPPADVGLVVTRQFYLRVVGVRDGSPAARAGIRTGDFIRGIDGKPTRDVSALAGTALLRGAAGSKVELTLLRGNATEAHVVSLTRELPQGDLVTSRKLAGGDGYVRVERFQTGTAGDLQKQFDALRQAGVTRAVVDLRGVADGTADDGVAAARLFVKTGTLATRAGRGADRTVVSANAGDGAIAMPIVLLVSNGTANAAEIFAAALAGNQRADLVGEPTAGIAAVQHFVRLPNNFGLWMTYERYLTTDGKPIHEHGLPPAVAVEEPTVAFGDAVPSTDDMLNKAVERLKTKKDA
jgi:carboxyl-terminal processing protease